MKHVLATTLPELFPSEHLDAELIQAAIKKAMVEKHSDRDRKVPTWSGKSECKPGQFGSYVFDEGYASINTWMCPAYRLIKDVKPSTWLLDSLLRRIMPFEQDRKLFKDWLAWTLQNEADKPAWSVILYSQSKGTGKSTLVEVVSRLFGEGNSMNCKSVDDVTGRFAAPVFEKKFVSIEEVKLQQGTKNANAMKTFITEKAVAVERKNMNMKQIEQRSVFLMTTNHPPTWMEEGERRYLVIQMDHDGHSHGPDREGFARFIRFFKARVMANDQMIAAMYHGLMEHKIAEDFNPYSLAFDQIDTPIMKRLQSSGAEVQLERLEELLDKEAISVIPQEDLCRKVNEELHIGSNRVKHLMHDLGWNAERRKWGGANYQRTIWLRPGNTMLQGVVKDASGEPVAITYLNGFSEEEVEVIDEAQVEPDAEPAGEDY